jgi:hypothetical protein
MAAVAPATLSNWRRLGTEGAGKVIVVSSEVLAAAANGGPKLMSDK